MRRAVITACCVLLVAMQAAVTTAHNAYGNRKRVMKEYYRELPPECRFCLVGYSFQTSGGAPSWQGWTRVDNTAQPGVFFHVDDFDGISPGDFGGLVPITDARSMWCGIRPNGANQYTCSWLKAPGYGNGWNQTLQTDPIAVVGGVTFEFNARYHSESDNDFTLVEYDAGGLGWTEIDRFTGTGETAASYFIPMTTTSARFRFHFISDDAWSDQDGGWNSDGAFIVDDIRIRDQGGYDNYEGFEFASVGGTRAGIWSAGTEASFGDYSGLKNHLMDNDPCGENLESQVAFFVGSSYPSSSYPGLYDTPFCTSVGGANTVCQNGMIVSPQIDVSKYSAACNNVQDASIPSEALGLYGGYNLSFSVYRDLPLQNLVFYTWYVRNISTTGCPGPWLNRGCVYYGSDMDLFYINNNVSDLIVGPKVQLAVGIVDMCSVWGNSLGDCAAHTPSPWFDNVKLCRYQAAGGSLAGPNWSFRDIDLFQDNFPCDAGNIESTVRADAANDINALDDLSITPADAVIIDCAAPFGQQLSLDDGWPAIYMHVKCGYIGPSPAKPALFGPILEGDHGRYRSDDGTWTIIQGDSARTGPPHSAVIRDAYMFDLNDSLFTRGYKIEYYFTASSAAGQTRLPGFPNQNGSQVFESTCLPTLNSNVLFVDDFVGPTLVSDALLDNEFSGRDSWEGAVENYWMSVFKAVFPPPNSTPDKYDVNGSSSLASNGLGSRAHAGQLAAVYGIIIWDCGDLESGTIADGTVKSDKSDDCSLLIDWMNTSEHPCGLWICGDNIAHDLAVNCGSVNSLNLLNNWCGVDYFHQSYVELTGGRGAGGRVNPRVAGNQAGILLMDGAPYRFYVYGGCPIINSFDVLDVAGTGVPALDYPDYGGTSYHAGIQNTSTNLHGQPVRTMWFGFSYQCVRDDALFAPIDRFALAKRVTDWMGGVTKENVTGGTVPGINSVAQNYPNPFNPVTTINYDLKQKGPVTVKVYNVAGELVRTLVDAVLDAGSYSVIWDGTNNGDASVSSGIYLYRMETTGFSKTRKMVLLR
jgi:hypothetical protein